jgi:ABC-type Mn2+/Zn2+ transport system permease subunit
MTAYIFERFVIHFVSACSLVLMAFFFIAWLARRYRIEWIPGSLESRLAVSAGIVCLLSTYREAYDVAHGQILFKAFTDYVSWLLGCGCAAWGLYRFHHLEDE